jgi:hypothetical protein
VNKLLCLKILIFPTLEQRDKNFFQTKVFEHRSHHLAQVLNAMWEQNNNNTWGNQETPKKRYITANEQLSDSKIIKKMKRAKTKKKGRKRSSSTTVKNRKNGK